MHANNNNKMAVPGFHFIPLFFLSYGSHQSLVSYMPSFQSDTHTDERLNQRLSSIVTEAEQHDAVSKKLDTVSRERHVPFQLDIIYSHKDM